jgi:opacity protein-like surface antigen
MKKLLLTAAALVALVSSASAQQAMTQVGNTLHFNAPRPIAVGWTNTDDAMRIQRWHRADDQYAKLEFVNWLNKSKNESRFCIVMNDSPDNSWKVVKTDAPTRNGQWACFQAKYDFRPVAEQTVQSPCLWLFLPS